MALTPSNMLPLGTAAPDFSLPDVVTGETVQLYQQEGYQAYVVMFICNHCPYVVHVEPELLTLARDYQKRDVAFFAISSNDIERYPQDGPEEMKKLALEHDYPFPYLYDASQSAARAYDAACTPDFYVFDPNKRLVYRGRLDASRPQSDVPLTGEDLRQALDAVLSGQPVDPQQFPSMGCNIKWKS